MLKNTSYQAVQRSKTFNSEQTKKEEAISKEKLATFFKTNEDNISFTEEKVEEQNTYINIKISNGNFSTDKLTKIFQEKNIPILSISTTSRFLDRFTEIQIKKNDLETALLPTGYRQRAKRSITFEL